MLLNVFICCVLGYLLGSLNPSFLIVRRKGYDVRKDGSENAGASNAYLLAGKGAFFAVATLDILKAFLACWICQQLFPTLSFAPQLGGAACILGHIYPITLGFHGGKGLACLGGVVLYWSWKGFLILLFIAVVIVTVTKYICFVAPSISVLFPICYFIQSGQLLASMILLVPAGPIIHKHRVNFARIRNGTEPRIFYLWNKDEELRRIGRN